MLFRSDRINPHDLSFRLALKFYRPDVYPDVEAYQKDMARIARVAMKLTRPQQDRLLDVFNVVESGGVQVVPMEWVDGIDLAREIEPPLATIAVPCDEMGRRTAQTLLSKIADPNFAATVRLELELVAGRSVAGPAAGLRTLRTGSKRR